MISGFTKYRILSYSKAVIADSPLAYWRLGEPTGSVAADSSGSGYNGTYQSCTQGTSALINNNGGNLAVSGNGTSSYILIGAVSALINLSRSFSIEAWIKPSSVASGFISGVWSSGRVGTNVGGFCARQNGTNIELLADYYASLGTVNCSFVVGTRYHIVVTVSSTGTATIYCNGVSMGTINVSAYTYAGASIILGGDWNGSGTPGTFLSGSLDEVAVYNSILSSTQVTNHWNAGG